MSGSKRRLHGRACLEAPPLSWRPLPTLVASNSAVGRLHQYGRRRRRQPRVAQYTLWTEAPPWRPVGNDGRADDADSRAEVDEVEAGTQLPTYTRDATVLKPYWVS